MGNRVDCIAGKEFGRLTVLDQYKIEGRLGASWLCRCLCGTEKWVLGNSLKTGNTRSCGCYSRDVNIKRQTKHGAASGPNGQTTEYRAWKAARYRCFNPTHPSFEHYGGRGITMCDRWKNDFREFVADMGFCPPDMSLERINNDGNYEPSNCKWATQKEQTRNQRKTIFLTRDGIRKSLREWAEDLGIKPFRLYYLTVLRSIPFEQVTR